MKVIAVATIMGLVSTLIFLTTIHVHFAFADPLIGSPLTPDFGIQSNGDRSGYIVCDPNCHIAANNGSGNNGSGNNGSGNNGSGNNGSGNNGSSEVQPAYRLTVNVPSHPFGISIVDISLTTENGHTDQANVPTAGGLSYTFNIPENQGKSVQVCVKPGNLSVKNCHTYKTTGSDMSVSLPAVSSTSSGTNYRHIGPWSGGGGYDAYLPPSFGYP